MSSSNLSISDMQHAVRDTVRHHWQLFLTQGVIMTILGVLAVIWPQISTVAVDVYVGILAKIVAMKDELKYEYFQLEHAVRHVIQDEQEHISEIRLLLGK